VLDDVWRTSAKKIYAFDYAMECVEMKRRIQISSTFAATLLLGSSLFAQEALVAPPPTPTLWSFLGIPQGAQKIQGALFNRRGNRPRLEPDTPMRALNDPRNLFSKVPAIKKAAEIKQAEDLKPQKIKSIKYLASIGCGCYDKDGSVTDALIAAGEDCTEDVRLATMNAIHESASNKCCSNCGQICCCNEKLMTKLAEIAYERDDAGCYKEPSSRVRAAAAEALRACCPGGAPPLIESMIPEKEKVQPETIRPETETDDEDSVKPEGDSIEKALEDDGPTALYEVDSVDRTVVAQSISIRVSDQGAVPLQTEVQLPEIQQLEIDLPEVQQPQVVQQPEEHSQVRPNRLLPVPATAQAPDVRPNIAQMRLLMQKMTTPALSTPNPGGGVVMSFDTPSQTAYVHFEDRNLVLPSGAEVHLRPDPVYDSGYHGSWHVVESSRGCAILSPLTSENIEEVKVGDHVMFGAPPVVIAPVSYSSAK
jgi:hypothetical protein